MAHKVYFPRPPSTRRSTISKSLVVGALGFACSICISGCQDSEGEGDVKSTDNPSEQTSSSEASELDEGNTGADPGSDDENGESSENPSEEDATSEEVTPTHSDTASTTGTDSDEESSNSDSNDDTGDTGDTGDTDSTDGTGSDETPDDNSDASLQSITEDEIRDYIEYLASDELEGRFSKSDKAREVADFIAGEFESFGLTPGGDAGSFMQEYVGYAPNVIATRPGSGPGYILVTAHFDHLQMASSGNDRIYNGSDDNASGTAAMLEVAEAFGMLNQDPSATVVFMAFTAEELGLKGSRYWVQNPSFALGDIVGVFNMDMVSRNDPNLIFCEGKSEFPDLSSAVEEANGKVGLTIRYDEHPEWRTQSDHYSFIEADVPALYFGVEDHADYHKVTDHSDLAIPGLTAKVGQLVFQSVLVSDARYARDDWSFAHNPPRTPPPMLDAKPRHHDHSEGGCRPR